MGYEDDYNLEDMELTVSDYVQKTMEEAVKQVSQYLGLQACERSDKVAEGKSAHTLFLAGVFRGGHEVLVRAKLALSEGVTMQLTVRSEDADVAELITSTIG